MVVQHTKPTVNKVRPDDENYACPSWRSWNDMWPIYRCVPKRQGTSSLLLFSSHMVHYCLQMGWLCELQLMLNEQPLTHFLPMPCTYPYKTPIIYTHKITQCFPHVHPVSYITDPWRKNASFISLQNSDTKHISKYDCQLYIFTSLNITYKNFKLSSTLLIPRMNTIFIDQLPNFHFLFFSLPPTK
jgi:hypothetical protein